MFQTHGDTENGVAVRKIRGSIEGIDIPPVVGAALVASAFFADDIVSGPGRTYPFDDELFAGAIGHRDKVNVALVFNLHSLVEIAEEQRAGFASDCLDLRNVLKV